MLALGVEDVVVSLSASRLVARSSQRGTGRACPLCPARSDINLFRHGERVVDLDAEIADRALDIRVAEHKLRGP
jgi:hypothetical protein